MKGFVLPFLTALVLPTVVVCGCTEVDTPSRVRQFVSSQRVDSARSEEILLDSAGITVFRVTYGRAASCTPQCPVAYGLSTLGRIGWLAPPQGTTGGLFDIAATDTALFSLALVSHPWAADQEARGALHLRLASDNDTPIEVLRMVAGGVMSTYRWGPDIARALFASPRVGFDFQVLAVIASEEAWFWPEVHFAYDTAWARLRTLATPLSRLRFQAFSQHNIGPNSYTIGVETHNPDQTWAIAIFPPHCGNGIQFYRDSTFGGAASWDGDRWWAARNFVCPDKPVSVYLTPVSTGAVFQGGIAFTPADVLGDSLHAGNYWFLATARISTPTGDTTVVARGGPVNLAK